MLREGKVRDLAELVRLGHVSRARITQILNLLSLAPDMQETLLLLPLHPKPPRPLFEQDRLPIAAEPDWQRQRAMWGEFVA